MYKKLQDELSAQVLKEGKIVTEEVEVILKRLIRLVQVASNPVLVDESYSEIPPKLIVTKEIISKAIAQNSKVIVWTNFVENIEDICNFFDHKNIVGISGKVDAAVRDNLISRFRKEDDVSVLVATPGVARKG